MTGSTIDHLVSVTVFLAAILLFTGLFNQTIQTAIIYQRHRHLATKCSDLIDNILLNPGFPQSPHWGKSKVTPVSFGLQDPEFKQYRLSPFSLMRLRSFPEETVHYSKTGSYYNNITRGFGTYLLMPLTEAVNYSTAAKLLGVNGTYGFQMTITPVINISITEVRSNPLNLLVDVAGTGFPLSDAVISYCLIKVEATEETEYPSCSMKCRTVYADDAGSALLNFSSVDGENESYVLIVYAYLSGLVGVGYFKNVSHKENHVIPFISDFGKGEVVMAHSHDVYSGDHPAPITYNTTFVLLTEDFILREMPMENSTGQLDPHAYEEIKIFGGSNSTDNPGILVVTYKKNAQETGAVLMPWGISSMAFPVTFGGDSFGREWVATDTRQVVIDGIAYHAKLALWSLEGYGVIG